jgi:hypothetical protein
MSNTKMTGAKWRKAKEQEHGFPPGTLRKMNLAEALEKFKNQDVVNSNYEGSESVQTDPAVEEIQVDGQAQDESQGFGSLLKRARAGLKETFTADESPARKNKKASQSTRDDFSLLVVSVVTLAVALSKMEERLKPEKNEIELFSNHVSGILLRHLPINSKLSADALDVIGIFAVVSGWYARVQVLQQVEQQPVYQPLQQVPVNGKTQAAAYRSPIADIAPATEAALNRVRMQAQERSS